MVDSRVRLLSANSAPHTDSITYSWISPSPGLLSCKIGVHLCSGCKSKQKGFLHKEHSINVNFEINKKDKGLPNTQ